MENTGGDASWLNGKNERHNISIHNMVREGIIGINQHENKRCCTEEISEEVHRRKIQSTLDNNSPNFAWYGQKTIMH